MEEDVADARSKRRCTRRGNQASGQPSAVHYVGYVEDDETPEMIMAKFEALDRIQASSHSPGEEGKAGNVNTVGLEILAAVEERSRDGCLTDAQLLEVFKQTSIFNVKTALADNEALLSIDDLLCQYADRYGSDEEVSDDEDWIQTFWSATGSSVDGQEKRGPLVSYDSWLKCKAAAATYEMVSWGFMYIENLTWVYLSPNHTVSREESPFFASSHLTLYMFRWADRGREMELRHQRNPDVLFDCCLPIAGSPCHAVPQAVYDTIETLLPGAKDRFLELWAAQGSARPGWTQAAFALDGVCT
ncbi:hypothetical protein F751_3801 [Auxenochlorella protothecoides]|uniref:Uncharacterized protein n=1 Tax=Auxenochlorella protothecoides TaxID=3075 RepID=A0A087SGD5_AUXPR|nr:hypothetical protein F751_3801 [Auxenochlorella protothecoides]KFM24789.1 hypothetical protein F751_3801 [Auxenochlorella protothecoides]